MRKRLLALLGCVGRRRKSPVEATHAHRADAPIPVLVISLEEADRISVGEFLRGTRFVPVCAGNADQASKLLREILFPILLFDPFPYTGEWQTHVDRFVRAWRRPMLLLLSSPGEADSYEHAVCRAGLGILHRPVQPDNLIAALDVAYTKWSEGFVDGRTPCGAMAGSAAVASNALCGLLPGCVNPLE